MKLASIQCEKSGEKQPQPRPASTAVTEFELPLPSSLRRFGKSTLASLTGPDHAPLVVVLGGISANRFPCRCPDGLAGWWPGLTGFRRAVNPEEYRVLGIDFVADAEGRVAPAPIDQAAVVCAALDRLGVAKAHAVVGASYGGMIALNIGQHFPGRAERLVVISADAAPHPAATAVRDLQRRVVALGIQQGAAVEALSIARGMAMLSYRTRDEFAKRFRAGIETEETGCCSGPGAYLKARGDAFRQVMTPERFLSLSASIDRHRVEPERISTPTLLIGAETDQLVPAAGMRALADSLGGFRELHILPSLYGHDMFLKDTDRFTRFIEDFLGRSL